MKKLSLNKETIAKLSQEDFSNVQGGTITGLSDVVGVQCFGPSEDCSQDPAINCDPNCTTDNPNWLLETFEASCWLSCGC